MPKSLDHDKLFTSIVTVSTGMGFAVMMAALAALRRGEPRGFAFTWDWRVLPWMFAAIVWNWRFWEAVWQAQRNPTPTAKKRFQAHLVVSGLIGLGAFLYPLRFLWEFREDLAKGLITAALFLGTLGFLIFKVGRGLAAADKVELARFETEARSDP